MIAKEGFPTIIIAIVLAALLWWLGSYLHWSLRTLLSALGIGLVLLCLWFFRDPDRTTPTVPEDNLIIAPADGKVILIEDVVDTIYLNGPARQISIFLSPLDVHINRLPASGVIEQAEYVPGEYLVAWHEKSSELNERSLIGLRHHSGTPILFKQIAGFLARRVVFYLDVDQEVEAGARFGLMKFGSRMDILVPPEIDFDVAVGDRVVAGETVIGKLPITGSTPAEP